MTPHALVVRDADVVVARLCGDVDLTITEAVTAEVLDAVPNDVAGLIVDLTAIRYLDSAGVHMLFEFARQLGVGRQGMAILVAPDSPVRRLLEITGMPQAAPVCTTPEACKDAVRAAGR